MERVTFYVIILAVAGLIAFLFWWFSADQKARRAMRSTPRRTIREVIEGERARIVGRAHVATPVRAPLSGRQCGYWRVVVQEYRSRGRSGSWVTVVDEHEGVDFVVHDDSGKALVKTAHVHAVLEKDAKYGSGMFNSPTPELEAFLDSRGISSKGLLFNKRMRFREGVVEHGELVAVVGVGRWERDPEETARAGDGYRTAEMPQRLVVDAMEDGSPLLLSDEASMTT